MDLYGCVDGSMRLGERSSVASASQPWRCSNDSLLAISIDLNRSLLHYDSALTWLLLNGVHGVERCALKRPAQDLLTDM